MTHPTIRDVAQRAGVGIGTVSRVLNNSPLVTPETRQRILDAIAELGFRPNSVARQLPRKTRIQNIGVITQPFIHYLAFAERMRGVQIGLSEIEQKYELVLYSVSSLPHYEEQLTYIVTNGLVDGLIIIDLDLSDAQKQMLIDANLPFVGINNFQGYDWPCIGADNVLGGRVATRHLVDLGHQRIAYLGDEFHDPFHFKTSQQRFDGFKSTLEQHSVPLPNTYICLGRHDDETARSLTRDLLHLPNRPTAIFAMSDIQALACLDVARDLDIRIPEDLSIIGFDDLQISYHVGLTTVRQHFELSGKLAVEMLLALIQGRDPRPPALPPLELIVRKTTDSPRRS
ncbi:MAG: LacI family DNA-binding transcriptional regulator [Anaerolineae bacterium]|nr:LacI family DNA-binding transcriptional regulator [Anaerolineae bacterium]